MFFIFDVVVDNVEKHYVFDEYENASLLMSLSPLKKKYNEFKNLKKAINEFFKNYDYAINIRDFDKNKKNVKNIVYFCCNKNQTMKFNKNNERR